MTVFVGVDPGLGGSVAAIDERGRFVHLFDMPVMANGKAAKVQRQVDPLALANGLGQLRDADDAVMVAIERVSAMPGQGVSSVFSFGDSFGAIRAAVAIRLFPYELVPPAVWKKSFGLSADKEQARAEAIRRYPDAAKLLARKKDVDRAEALLIATWLMRKYA